MSKPDAKRLQQIFSELTPAAAQQLLEFAEFLHARHAVAAASLPSLLPQDIPRPAQESVIKAIKRLAATYPMLDRGKMLHETSALMTQHVVQGRDAVAVIDDLEAVFRQHYARLRNIAGASPALPDTSEPKD